MKHERDLAAATAAHARDLAVMELRYKEELAREGEHHRLRVQELTANFEATIGAALEEEREYSTATSVRVGVMHTKRVQATKAVKKQSTALSTARRQFTQLSGVSEDLRNQLKASSNKNRLAPSGRNRPSTPVFRVHLA